MRMPKIALGRALCQTAVLVLLSGTLLPILAQQPFQRKYKATAYVMVFGILIFSRADVGYGWAVEESRERQSNETVELEFLAGSIPERAHGLNRFGYIRESVEERNRTPIRAEYFGLMTASREESLKDARAALNAQAKCDVPYVAASGQIGNHHASYSVRHLVLPEPRPSAEGALMRLVKASFASAHTRTEDVDKTFSTSATQPFLYALRNAMLSTDTNWRAEFLFNGKLHILNFEKHPDHNVESEMRRQGLVTGEACVLRLTGVITNESRQERTNFTVWYQKGIATILPLRFEVRPRTYLKLVFDAQPQREAAVGKMSLAEWSPIPSALDDRR